MPFIASDFIIDQASFCFNEKGLEIAEETSKRDDGFTNFTVEGQMILKNKAGKESLRKL